MKPNVLFLIIDSLRADKFPQKNQNNSSPNISSLIQNGTLFSNTISSANATILSWSSLFTSKFPFKTGIRSSRFNKLDSNIETSFDVLKNNNYRLYGYLPKLSETVGLFPKFDNDDYLYDFYIGLSNGLGEEIIKKTDSNLPTPWFFLVHSMDLHQPINVSKKFDITKFGMSSYERKVSEIDFWIGKIIKKIDLKNTILIITGDHGDYIKSANIANKELDFNPDHNKEVLRSKISKHAPKFLKPLKDKVFFSLEKQTQVRKSKILHDLDLRDYEKRAIIAGKADKDHFLFDELIKVPLLIVSPQITKNLLINQQIRTVDIFPTLFDLLGLKFQSDIDGVNLKPLINGESMQEQPAYIESNPLVLTESNDVIGIRTSKYKYFRDKNDPSKRIHLFNLKTDPYEETNLSSETELIKKFEEILISLLGDYSEKISQNTSESDEIEQELRKLGYV